MDDLEDKNTKVYSFHEASGTTTIRLKRPTMRPAHLLTILFATSLLIGCGPNVVDMTQIANQDGEGFKKWDSDDLFYYKGKPFTGLAELVGDEHFDDGIYSFRIPFKKGKIDSSAGWEAFYATGQIAHRCEEFVKTAKKYECYNGRLEEWYMNGQMSHRSNYKDGRQDGLSEGWHENGQMSERGNYKDGDRLGLYEGWHENGQMSYRVNYKDGRQDGLSEGWYENGQRSKRGNTKDGEWDGLYEAWYENGQIGERGNYKEGSMEGLHEKWYKNGQIAARMNVKDGSLWERWYENGQLAKQFLYRQNGFTQISCWDENGQRYWNRCSWG